MIYESYEMQEKKELACEEFASMYEITSEEALKHLVEIFMNAHDAKESLEGAMNLVNYIDLNRRFNNEILWGCKVIQVGVSFFRFKITPELEKRKLIVDKKAFLCLFGWEGHVVERNTTKYSFVARMVQRPEFYDMNRLIDDLFKTTYVYIGHTVFRRAK